MYMKVLQLNNPFRSTRQPGKATVLSKTLLSSMECPGTISTQCMSKFLEQENRVAEERSNG